jgi:hypothetical protein
MNFIRIPAVIFLILTNGLLSCERDSHATEYKTENVIIIVIDGPRYSETWGDSHLSHIPGMKKLSETGVFFSSFYNKGATNTVAGYTSITTGNNQEINDLGLEIPDFPSFFQYWNKEYAGIYPVSRLIVSKFKLSVLSDCIDSIFSGIYMPSIDCGDGTGTGYRDDSITFELALKVLADEHPRLALIGFGEPDISAHQNNWSKYIAGIESTDRYVSRIWDFIEGDLRYKGKTSLFITNDHGRHLDGIADGFISHGDTCLGCRHISLLALGPDFNKGENINKDKDLTDIPATIAEILKFPMPTGHGTILKELFK